MTSDVQVPVAFVKAVAEMRAAQKAWLKDKRRGDLDKAKRLERRVDTMLWAIQEPTASPDYTFRDEEDVPA